jgi:cobalt/nickel transport system ATP-binding protein
MVIGLPGTSYMDELCKKKIPGRDNQVRLDVLAVEYRYPDGTIALSDIRLQVKAGEFIGILGPNGSGKTTLLKVMNGLLNSTKGNVLLDGANIRKLSARDIYRTVGLVFQNPEDQLFATTVFEDVAFGPQNLGFSPEDVYQRVRCALKSVDMEEHEKKHIHKLSFGQKKRICIAGLLAMGHEILLLDEPTAGLDPLGESRMMELLYHLNKERGVTIVMATHSVDFVPLFLDRVLVMSKGSIVKQGMPEEVFSSPEEMSEYELRLPQVAELIYLLRNVDKLPFEKLPLTVGEARRAIIRLQESGNFGYLRSADQGFSSRC